MIIKEGDLRIIANKIYYQGVCVGTINDLDMSNQRFKFQDFLKFIEKKGFYDKYS